MSQAALPEIDDDDARALDHSLAPHFDALARFDSTRALRASPLYARLRPEIERVLAGVVRENSAVGNPGAPPPNHDFVRATAWNIERGKRLAGIVSALRSHPVLRSSDVLLLTELDYGMARTGNRFVAREIAEELGMNYAFAPCYVALNKGSGLESRVEGENTQALHGNALFSRFPVRRAHSLALPNGKDKMSGKEKRLGSQRAVVADVEHPLGAFRAVSLHLDAHSTQAHRALQMRLVLEHVASLGPQLPTLVGGDWNTTTYNSRRATYAILGYFRRVAMGVSRVVEQHYPHPDRWFERRLFREIERRGFSYRELNAAGAGTLHYDVTDVATNSGMRDWVPGWCFPFIDWALAQHGGRCSLKLDWFAGRGIEPASEPRVVNDLRDDAGALSDHDPIVLDFVPKDET
ncbi:MAG: endonuclease/exonuclease/phosphatase family protein [Acidobacteria bacterium]|nr:endonuclease/exonuclease/phosphatase family protein [Acidobacteriota bacterium]MCA1641821.1 endonuclease/exonuclease/phosphatase family protein [Acidobacteriota bacterium]